MITYVYVLVCIVCVCTKNIIYPQLVPSMLIVIVVYSPIGSIWSKKCSHSWLPPGSTSSSVCGTVVTHVPSGHVCLCSDKCAFIVYYAGGVCKIILVVTGGDHHTVLANIIGYSSPTPPPLPMVYIAQGFFMGILTDRTQET